MSIPNSPMLNVGRQLSAEPEHLACAQCEMRFEMRIAAEARDIFPYLIHAKRMKTWLAREVRADPQPGGIFRLSDISGLWIEGMYLEIISHQRVAFTWGGIHGLKIGDSIVEFTLLPDAAGTMLRLRHAGLPTPAFDMHHLGWQKWGLSNLKRVAEGNESIGTYLGSIADVCEQLA